MTLQDKPIGFVIWAGKISDDIRPGFWLACASTNVTSAEIAADVESRGRLDVGWPRTPCEIPVDHTITVKLRRPEGAGAETYVGVTGADRAEALARLFAIWSPDPDRTMAPPTYEPPPKVIDDDQPSRWFVDLDCGHWFVETRPAGQPLPVDGELRACHDVEHYPEQRPALYIHLPARRT